MSGDELTMRTRDRRREDDRARRWDVPAIFLIGVASFTITLPEEFVGLDARYALFTKEMLRNGPSFFPTTFSAPYPDYPATTIFPMALLSRVIGSVCSLSIVLPTAVVSAGVLVFIYLIGALRSRAWGLSGACVAVMTPAFLGAARAVSPDQCTSLISAAVFYVVYSASVTKHRRRLWLLPVLLVVGFACRGPIGLIVPAAVLCTLCLCNRDLKAFWLFGIMAVALLGMCGFALYAAAVQQGGPVFADRVFDMQALGRLSRGGRNILYYWASAPGAYALAFPLAMLVVWKGWSRIWRRDNADARLLLALVACTVVVLVGLSVPAEKKTRYILPIVPFIALVAAWGLSQPAARDELPWLERFVGRSSVVFPFLAAGACVIRAWLVEAGVIAGEIHMVRITACLLLAAALGFAFSTRMTLPTSTGPFLLALGAAGFLIVQIGVIEPILLARKGSSAFARLVEKQCASVNARIVFFGIGPDQEDVVLAANMVAPVRPRFAQSITQLLAEHEASCVIAAEGDADRLAKELPHRVRSLESGMLGGSRFALLQIEPEQRP